MLHDPALKGVRPRALVTRRRFQLGGALVMGVALPLILRDLTIPGAALTEQSRVALLANLLAVCLSYWVRSSIEPYPGIRSGAVILSTTGFGYGAAFAILLIGRLPYDRVALLLGLALTIVWSYMVYFLVQRRSALRIAVVPHGQIGALDQIPSVTWLALPVPRLGQAADCDAIVADFHADLPDEWERFLADAALAGVVVYHVKQLSESLTGRVEIGHLSENVFGSLIPAKAYFHLKSTLDLLLALVAAPLIVPVVLVAALAIRMESPGSALFRQHRIGHAGRPILVYKLRTMHLSLALPDDHDERSAAMTDADDPRITRVGAFLRRSRIDELPQVWNILKGEMSWIGPRPEAAVLSSWYSGEIPFYRYRHVVKPGISGWAQVNQGHVADVEEVSRKLQYDFYYIKHFSPWLDILILFKTIRTILSGFGSR